MTLNTFEVRHRTDGGGRLIQSSHKVFQFPGGESHIVFEPTSKTQIAYLHGADGNDLIALAMWADAIKRTKGEYQTIACIPYLPGARADRGTPLGAKVYADMVNAMGIDHVVAVDPHSDVAPALYDRLTVIDAVDVMPNIDALAVIAPDAGAVKRAEAYASGCASGYDLGIVHASKHRDFATGKLSGFSCESLPFSDGTYLMVDDICDGGGTFLGLADEINRRQDEKYNSHDDTHLELWVTHGIFSNHALLRLAEKFDHIYTTDSFFPDKPQESGFLTVVPLLDKMVEAAIGKVN